MGELSFRDHDKAFQVAKMLMDEDYVVMLSYEDSSIILNYEWSHNCNRNNIVFGDAYDYIKKDLVKAILEEDAEVFSTVEGYKESVEKAVDFN